MKTRTIYRIEKDMLGGVCNATILADEFGILIMNKENKQWNL